MNSSFKTSTSWSPWDAKTASTQCPAPGSRTCDTGEPSERGIGGIERMRLVRDDIAARVADLQAQVNTQTLRYYERRGLLPAPVQARYISASPDWQPIIH